MDHKMEISKLLLVKLKENENSMVDMELTTLCKYSIELKYGIVKVG